MIETAMLATSGSLAKQVADEKEAKRKQVQFIVTVVAVFAAFGIGFIAGKMIK